MKNIPIYINQWHAFKPYDSQTNTDAYYLKLCNEVKKSIEEDYAHLVDLNQEENGLNELSCFLSSYFEDLISGTNIWNSFIRYNKRLYGKYLPFYQSNDYVEHEINEEDVSFLIWYFINTRQREKFVFPLNKLISQFSSSVMVVFENAWEYAPENTFLKKFYTIDEGVTDFYKLRDLMDTVLFKSYLFYPDTLQDLKLKENEIIEEDKGDENLVDILIDNRINFIHGIHTKLFGIKGNEWVAEILGEHHSLSRHYRGMSERIIGYFFYKGQDEDNVYIEHIASSKKFSLNKISFHLSDILKELDKILFLGIVRWRNDWHFSGTLFEVPFDADLILEEKRSIQSRNSVSFLDFNQKKMEDLLFAQGEAFKKLNDGQEIAFMPLDKVDSFAKNFINFYNSSLNLSQKESDEAFQRARTDGFRSNLDKSIDLPNEAEIALVFFNPKRGLEIALLLYSAFPLKNNPYYKKEESQEHILRLFMSHEFSPELVMFCIENCKEKLEFLNTKEGRFYLNNIDFLLRFWKGENYFIDPNIVFFGQDS